MIVVVVIVIAQMKRGLQPIPIILLTLCFFMSVLFFPKIRAQAVQQRTLPAFIDVRRGITSSSSKELSSRPASTKYTTVFSSHRILPLVRPPDPASFNSDDNKDDDCKQSYIQNQAQILREWMRGKKQIICITGAGMSTESNIPDYRGSNGSYFRGHKPIIHHEFMNSPSHRKRYWSRSLVGYSPFANAKPNLGHYALAKLEANGYIGVDLKECDEFDQLGESCFGHNNNVGELSTGAKSPRRISVITQNVDSLHSTAGLKHCLHLHGRGDIVTCQNCSIVRDRKEYHDELTQYNQEWLSKATSHNTTNVKDLRPDGDAELGDVSHDDFILPPCPNCGDIAAVHNITANDIHQQENQSFFKTAVVFFGDNVPRHRFDISNSAIDTADGVLCIGTSLAVHSAFRLVKRSIEREVPVLILNVGETRVEREGLGDGLVTKVESPIGDTLNELVNMLDIR